MVKCSFCGKEIPKGKGIIYAKADGKVFYFCSSKCKKNALNLGRLGRHWKWTNSFRDFKEAQKKSSSKKAKAAKPKAAKK